jgi:hypothetical protein
MAESHVVSALVNKRAEIAGMIARTEQQLGQFRADLVHLDATIRLFAPGMEPQTIPAKRIRQSDLWFEQGELSRRVLDALRRAGEPIRAPDLVKAVMIDKGLDPADRPSIGNSKSEFYVLMEMIFHGMSQWLKMSSNDSKMRFEGQPSRVNRLTFSTGLSSSDFGGNGNAE